MLKLKGKIVLLKNTYDGGIPKLSHLNRKKFAMFTQLHIHPNHI